ncbi:hypothetical protein PPYR_03206 [Photinus pyralis]|uniref:Peptidase S1 domain-containing protein n=3 Tax=Photinus pyralis TaxID=7054 RepID=A0A5N4A285_PHOPY|nr:serine protease gd-like [Photinus pyralis]KAB0791406.1 hypothetical protein PPYR_03206 [Photinus pyralis]
MKLCALLLTAAFCQCAGNVLLEVSPCPRLFVYERTSSYNDRWFGIITLLNDATLNGIWLRVSFDRPIIQLGNWFGEVVKKSTTEYVIKNPNFNLKAHTPKIVRIFVKYNVNAPPPQVVGFKLNARTVCPEEVVSTTPSTTTEHLFTNSEDQVTPDLGSRNNVMSTDDSTTELNFNEQPLFISHLKPHSNPTSTCGTISTQPSNAQPQIAYKGQFPWHVALYYTKDVTIAYLCGASLISPDHIVTVAHCVVKGSTQTAVNPDRLVAYMGKYFLKHWTQEGTQTRYISKISPHPNYKSETNANDIALLRLTNSVEFTDIIRPVCLWTEEVGTNVGSVVGWGFDEIGRIEEKLMYVQMAIQGEDTCNVSVANYSVKFNNDLTYCASFLEDTLECVGDSGGGMVFRTDDGIWQLRGIVTVSVVLQHQLKCGPQQYAVFTDVSKYHSWIKETLAIL